MVSKPEFLADIAFTGAVIEWRGPAPFFFIVVPAEQAGEISYAARLASYGWGCVPVQAMAAGTRFTTSLFPRDGSYLLPLKATVRKQAQIELGDIIPVKISVAMPG